MRRQRVVYGLHAGDLMFGYIGSTAVNAKTRWWEHRSRAQRGHAAPVYEWMRTVGINSIKVETLLEVAEGDDLKEREAALIADYLAAGHPLANQHSRDGIVDSMSSLSKGRIGAANSGKTTWIKGRSGADAGWTPERRARTAATRRTNRERADETKLIA